MNTRTLDAFRRGLVIPAHPLALTDDGRFDERRQRALTRYYIAAGSGGLGVGVHTTQFAIREPRVGLFEPVLALAADEMNRADAGRDVPLVRIGGICGPTDQALGEADLLARLGYHAGLLSLAALASADDDTLIAHCRRVSERLPIVGFYLQSSVGGRPLSYGFWRRLAEIPGVIAVKIAPFNRYQTLDVVRAIVDAGRDDITLYTGNDDAIVADLITPFRLAAPRGASVAAGLQLSDVAAGLQPRNVERRIVGGLLGHWSVWTRKAVELLEACQAAAKQSSVPASLLRTGIEVTDSNAAFFDAANRFAGCIAGLHEVLRRQGLLTSIRCLDPHETLSPGQREEIDRVYLAYPHLHDDEFVASHLPEWLRE